MDTIFLNGPIQNGPFTFASHPGKAVGPHIAHALNGVLGNRPARHLWNCSTLANDLRHRALEQPPSRREFERAEIRRKYRGTPWESSAVETATDTDRAVQALARDMIAEHLSTGRMEVRIEPVHVCADCDHMVGAARQRTCAACGSARSLIEKQPQDRKSVV